MNINGGMGNLFGKSTPKGSLAQILGQQLAKPVTDSCVLRPRATGAPGEVICQDSVALGYRGR